MHQVNWALMLATVLIVIGFGSSSALAAAYGIAVSLTMVITVMLLYVHDRALAMAEAGRSECHTRFPDDRPRVFWRQCVEGSAGWMGDARGCAVAVHVDDDVEDGTSACGRTATARAIPLDDFIEMVSSLRPARVPGTAVFMTAQPTGTPPALAHNVRYNKVLHDHVVVLTVSTAQQPHVPPKDRIVVEPLGHALFNVRVQHGFMEDPDVPTALEQARLQGLELDSDDLTYFLGRETIIVTRRKDMAIWREKLFVLMARNAVRATAFFRLPPERVVELGVQVEL